MDDIDRAQELDDLFRQDALIRHGIGRRPAAVTKQDQSETRFCVDCGKKIPMDRMKINPRAIRCVACQAAQETSRRMVSG